MKILQSDEIYRLLDMYKLHQEELKKLGKEKYRHLAVFPCKLKIMWECIFNKRNPIICGVRVEDGFIRLGTPICVPSRDVRIKNDSIN
jgi:translation initiation factor 5B